MSVALAEAMPKLRRRRSKYPGGRIVLQNIPWQQYVRWADALEPQRIRLTYDRGRMEVMTLSPRHEGFKKWIARLIEVMAFEREIDIRSFGSTTLRKRAKRRGLEPDEWYYVQNEPAVRGKIDLDFAVDLPPDLAIEVEVSRSYLDRLDISAKLGIRELWLWNGVELGAFGLVGDRYQPIERSLAFPFLRVADLVPHVAFDPAIPERQRQADFLAWLRAPPAARK